MKLTKEELDILNSVEQDEWTPAPNFSEEKKRFEASARASLRKDKRVNIRMSEKDLVSFQKRALEEGLPYQTLISSVLHKYINRFEG